MEHMNHKEEEHLEETAIIREDPEETVAEEITRVIKKEDKKEWMLPASILAAALMISVAFVYATGSRNGAVQGIDKNEPVVVGPKVTDGDAVLGNADAKVIIIEYGDFQCPYCGKFFAEVQPFIKKAFIDTGKAKMVYKPLAFLGPESEAAVTAVECAQEQGKFWEMHDGIFTAEFKEVEKMIAGTIKSSENNGNLTFSLFKKIGEGIGLDQDAFKTCYDSGKQTESIAAHMQEAQEVMSQGISTPSVYVNGKQVDPRVMYDQAAFSALIDAAAKK